MKPLYWRLLPLAIFVALMVFLWRGLSLEPQKLPSVRLGNALPSFHLPMLDKKQHFTEKAMQGQVALLNVWASWCTACVDEQVFLMRLAREGIPIYGLNYKDNTKNAKRWLKDWGNPYRGIGEDKAGALAMDLGVYGVPETFLIDKKGILRYRHAGVMDELTWKHDFLPRIKQLQGEA